MENPKKKRGERILSLRKDAGLTFEALAEKLGVTYQSVREWEIGKTSPSADNIGRLAEVFGVHPTWIWTGLGPKQLRTGTGEPVKTSGYFSLKKFGRHLKRLRENTGDDGEALTREALASRLGLSVERVIKYEQGRDHPCPHTLRKMCKIFGVSACELLMVERGPAISDYERLSREHKKQIRDNIRLLLLMEGKLWEEK
jgi:transcriptional regulator with XRE-family HTH domain